MSGRHLLLRQDWKAAKLKAYQPNNAFTQHGSPLWTRAFGHHYLTRKQIELQPCRKVSIGYRERQGCKSPDEMTLRNGAKRGVTYRHEKARFYARKTRFLRRKTSDIVAAILPVIGQR